MFGGVYVLWIYYLLVRAAEAIGVPFYAFVALLLGVGVLYPGFYRDKHTFLYMFHVVVMWVSWIGIGAGVAFQLEIGSATDFLFFHALWNAYVGALAYLYMPTHGGMLIHDEDEKTLERAMEAMLKVANSVPEGINAPPEALAFALRRYSKDADSDPKTGF